jgi:hypothetical protein
MKQALEIDDPELVELLTATEEERHDSNQDWSRYAVQEDPSRSLLAG